jgi:hypothetical protein
MNSNFGTWAEVATSRWVLEKLNIRSVGTTNLSTIPLMLNMVVEAQNNQLETVRHWNILHHFCATDPVDRCVLFSRSRRLSGYRRNMLSKEIENEGSTMTWHLCI